MTLLGPAAGRTSSGIIIAPSGTVELRGGKVDVVSLEGVTSLPG